MSNKKSLVCCMANPLYGEDVGYYNNGNYVKDFESSDLFSGDDASCIMSVPVSLRSVELKQSMSSALASSKGGEESTWLQVINSLWTLSETHYGKSQVPAPAGKSSQTLVEKVTEFVKANPLVAIAIGFAGYKLIKKVLR